MFIFKIQSKFNFDYLKQRSRISGNIGQVDKLTGQYLFSITYAVSAMMKFFLVVKKNDTIKLLTLNRLVLIVNSELQSVYLNCFILLDFYRLPVKIFMCYKVLQISNKLFKGMGGG